ncbi:MAG TPA: PAS domain S-box protein, partial [Candidatus Dormibacteraeota bacterium]|nr:PAS domain S-box protein [Candidatus Dormibacteraeota bacterium]
MLSVIPRRARILIVEDRVADAELVLADLRRAGIDPAWERVDDEAAFRAKLPVGWDLILCDFNLPQFDAMLALAILKESGQDIPFIIVSGSIGEQLAVDSMRGGASDYIFKDNLARLGAAATRELEAADQRRAAVKAREESGARFTAMIGSSLDAVIVMDDAGRILDWNPQAEALFGWTAAEAVGQMVAETIVPPALRAAHQTGLARYLETGEAHILNRRMELTAWHRYGHEFPVEVSVARISVDGGLSFSAFVRDITERKRADRMRKAHTRVSRAISETGSLEAVLAKALNAVGSQLGWDVGQVWLRSESDGLLRCAYQWVGPAAHVAQFGAESEAARFAPGEGMVGRVWLSRESVWLEDLSLAPDARLAEAAGPAGLTSAVFAPVFAGSEVNGVLQFFSHARRPADPPLLQLMSDLSGRIGEFVSRAQSAVALRVSESRFRGLFYNVGVAKAIIALPSGLVEAINPAFSALLGYEPEEAIGKSSRIFFDLSRHQPSPYAVPAPSPASPAFQGDIELRRKDGVPVWASISVTTIFNDTGQPQNLLFQAQDISKRREAEDSLAEAQMQLRHRAGHDALTELPNR